VLRRLGLAEKMDAMANPIKHGVRSTAPKRPTAVCEGLAPRSKLEALDSTTWQVRRSTFDEMMLKEAEARGAKIMRGVGDQPAPER